MREVCKMREIREMRKCVKCVKCVQCLANGENVKVGEELRIPINESQSINLR
jgi:hypothetical protein